MHVIGFSSGTVGRMGNVDRIVQAIMDKSGHDNEFVKLTELAYSGCRGCSWLCAKPQVCKLKDDLYEYYHRIKEADAIVVGCPVYGGGINAIGLAFLERFFGYGHVTRSLQHKPFIGVVCGYTRTDIAVEQLRRKLRRVNLIEVVEYCSSTPPCVRCGRHRECSVGGLYRLYGSAALTMDITPDILHRWEDDPDVVIAVEMAASALRNI